MIVEFGFTWFLCFRVGKQIGFEVESLSDEEDKKDSGVLERVLVY